MKSLNRVEISAEALRNNFAICREHAQGADVLVMVKADAYGHGMIDCATVFVKEGATALGVAEVVEGVALREAGFTLPVLVLAGLVPQEAETIIEYDLTPVVTDGAALKPLADFARRKGKIAPVQIKMDAGMGRLGTLPQDILALVQQIDKEHGLHLQGILAHFPMADDRISTSSVQVMETFSSTIEQIRSLLPEQCRLHIANSGGLFYVAGSAFDMVRPGISLYGYYPDGEIGRKEAQGKKLKPVMSYRSRIIQIRKVPEGSGLGYGHSFVTTRPTTLAVLPVGYATGYLRSLSNKAEVLIGGCRVPVIGRVSMNLTLVDITGMDNVQLGDEAVLLGTQGDEEITADDIAAWMDTISYEVLCLFGRMNDRVFLDS